MKIGVDIDGVALQTSQAWWEYLELDTKKSLRWDDVKHLYNVASAYSEELKWRGLDGMEFWRQAHLYDHLKPSEGAVETLGWLKGRGHKIVFISALKGQHHKSKVGFIKEWFPFYDAFLGTKEKEYVSVDVMIDDSNHVLNRFNDENVLLFKFDNHDVQPQNITVAHNTIEKWEELITKYAYWF